MVALITVLSEIWIRFFDCHVWGESILLLYVGVPSDKIVISRFLQQNKTIREPFQFADPLLYGCIVLFVIFEAERLVREFLNAEYTPALCNKIVQFGQCLGADTIDAQHKECAVLFGAVAEFPSFDR